MRADGVRLQIDGAERTSRLPCTDTPADLAVQDYLVIALKAHAISGAVAVDGAADRTRHDNRHRQQRHALLVFPVAACRISGRRSQAAIPAARNGGQLGRAAGDRLRGAARDGNGRARCHPARAWPHVSDRRARRPRGRRASSDCTRSWSPAGCEAPIRDDIRDEIWLKLCGNVCFNPISALTLATLDVIAGDPGTRACAAR